MLSRVPMLLNAPGSELTGRVGVKVKKVQFGAPFGMTKNSIEGRENFPMDRHFNISRPTIFQC